MLPDMQPGHPKELSKQTLAMFHQMVPTANLSGSVAAWAVGGALGKIRVKRAELFANQIHVWRGEPIAVHVPDGGKNLWYVLPVSWQLKFARANAKTANQHASHAFDCMMADRTRIPSSLQVAQPEADHLRDACERAILEARRREVRFVVKAVSRLRDAVADVLIDTFEEEFADDF